MKERFRKAHEETQFTCYLCGRPSVAVHHLKPRSRNGGDKLTNLIAICGACHNSADWLALKYFVYLKKPHCRGCHEVGKACFHCPVQK